MEAMIKNRAIPTEVEIIRRHPIDNPDGINGSQLWHLDPSCAVLHDGRKLDTILDSVPLGCVVEGDHWCAHCANHFRQ